MIRRIIAGVIATLLVLAVNARLDHDRTFNPPVKCVAGTIRTVDREPTDPCACHSDCGTNGGHAWPRP